MHVINTNEGEVTDDIIIIIIVYNLWTRYDQRSYIL